MNDEQYRKDIEAAVRHEDETGSFRALVERTLVKEGRDAAAAKERAASIVAEVRAYIESSAELMSSAMKAADEGGSGAQVRPIFETAVAYVSEEVDFIPDSLGLAGLVDDAYLVMGLVREMSARHKSLTGHDLVPASVFEPSARIRKMIGEPTATRLDVAIIAFARQPNIRDTIELILARTGSSGLSINLPALHSVSDGDPDEAPDLNLGALGG